MSFILELDRFISALERKNGQGKRCGFISVFPLLSRIDGKGLPAPDTASRDGTGRQCSWNCRRRRRTGAAAGNWSVNSRWRGGGEGVDVCVAHLSSCSSSSSRVQPGGTIFRPVGYAPSDVNFSPASARCLANYQRPDQRLTVARTVIRYGTGSQLPHLPLAHCPDSHPGVAVVWRRIRLRTKPAGEIVQQSVLDCWNASLA